MKNWEGIQKLSVKRAFFVMLSPCLNNTHNRREVIPFDNAIELIWKQTGMLCSSAEGLTVVRNFSHP